MKKMERKIALEYLIIAVASVIVNGLYNMYFGDGKFINSKIIVLGIICAQWYLLYLWILTRKYIVLTILPLLGTGIILHIISIDINIHITYNIGSVVSIISYIIIFILALHRAKDLKR